LITAQGADELLSISGIMASFVLCNINDDVFISGRSMGDINVQVILEKLGGGGHISVAGAQIVSISIEDAKTKLKEAIEEYFQSLTEAEAKNK
jgi:c-di-AMP phosphodiesterase-like protein